MYAIQWAVRIGFGKDLGAFYVVVDAVKVTADKDGFSILRSLRQAKN